MAEGICIVLFLVLAVAFAWSNQTVHFCGAAFCLALASLVIAAVISQRRSR